MSSIAVDLFCEDHAHREFVRAMVERLAREEASPVTVRERAAAGGHGAALTEFDRYQRLLTKNLLPIPDVVVVVIDANCRTYPQSVREIERHITPQLRGRVVVASPDPHVERWYLADPQSFLSVVGASPRPTKRKCKRGFYKGVLLDAVRKAGHPVTLGGIEFARDIVDAMDLDRASRNNRPLERFISEARAQLRTARG